MVSVTQSNTHNSGRINNLDSFQHLLLLVLIYCFVCHFNCFICFFSPSFIYNCCLPAMGTDLKPCQRPSLQKETNNRLSSLLYVRRLGSLRFISAAVSNLVPHISPEVGFPYFSSSSHFLKLYSPASPRSIMRIMHGYKCSGAHQP